MILSQTAMGIRIECSIRFLCLTDKADRNVLLSTVIVSLGITSNAFRSRTCAAYLNATLLLRNQISWFFDIAYLFWLLLYFLFIGSFTAHSFNIWQSCFRSLRLIQNFGSVIQTLWVPPQVGCSLNELWSNSWPWLALRWLLHSSDSSNLGTARSDLESPPHTCFR